MKTSHVNVIQEYERVVEIDDDGDEDDGHNQGDSLHDEDASRLECAFMERRMINHVQAVCRLRIQVQ